MSMRDFEVLRNYKTDLVKSRLYQNRIFIDGVNFFIYDKIAYTEDFVIVKNLYVSGFPKKCSTAEILRYFEKFGKVERLIMLQDKKTDPKFPTQNAFVNYQDPKSACRALRRRHHRLNRRTVRVQAADSWHQPEPHTALPPVVSTDSWFRLYRENFTGYTEHDSESDELLEEDEDYAPVKSYRRIKKKKTKGKNNQVATTTAAAVVEDKGTNILALNNDCLDMICSWLEPNEQVRFARTCTRFADIFATRCKHEYKTMDLEKFNYMTVWEMRDFLYYSGNYIEEIVNPIPNLQHEKILQLINKHCPNLQTATLTESALTPIQFKDLLRNAPRLKELQLRNSKLKKCWTKALVHASQLERLTFPRDTKYKAESLNSFVHLKELSVASCIVSAEELLKSYGVLQNLHTLDLRFVEGLESAFYNLLEGLCPQLETLKMTCPSHPYERVALLPRLNHLELVVDFLSDAEISVAMLEYLVEHKADQLSVLKLYAKEPLTAKHVSVLKRLKSLKILSVYHFQFCPDYKIPIDQFGELCYMSSLDELTIGNATDGRCGAELMLVQCYPNGRRVQKPSRYKIKAEALEMCYTQIDRITPHRRLLEYVVYRNRSLEQLFNLKINREGMTHTYSKLRYEPEEYCDMEDLDIDEEAEENEEVDKNEEADEVEC